MTQLASDVQFINPATVNTGQVDFGTVQTHLRSTGEEDGCTVPSDYMVFSRYEHNKHRYMLGITSPDGFQNAGVAFVQLAAPTLLLVTDWTAARSEIMPRIPPAESSDPDWVLLTVHYEPAIMTLCADQITPFYRISGTYVYGKKNPNPQAYKDVIFPKVPWMDDTFVRIIPEQVFDRTVTEVSNSTGGGDQFVGRVRG